MTAASRQAEPKAALTRRIVDLIPELGLEGGDRLPPERILAQRLGVSRATLRTALSGLCASGILETRVGSGTYVAAHGLASVVRTSVDLSRASVSPLAVLEARRILEPPIVRLAAMRANSTSVRLLELALDGMARDIADGGELSFEHDRTFHECLAMAAGNELLAGACRYLYSLDVLPDWVQMRSRLFARPGMSERYLAEHRQIFEAVSQHRAGAAERLMAQHVRHMTADVRTLGYDAPPESATRVETGREHAGT